MRDSRSRAPASCSPIVVAAAVFQAVLQTVIVPLLPELPHFTGAGRTAVSWLVTVTLLVGAVVTPIFGRLADMFGKKKMLLVAFSMMTLGSMLCALSSDIAVLIFARALQGAGSQSSPPSESPCSVTNCHATRSTAQWP